MEHTLIAGTINEIVHLVSANSHFKWLEAILMATTGATATIGAVDHILPIYGLSGSLPSNNSSQFENIACVENIRSSSHL